MYHAFNHQNCVSKIVLTSDLWHCCYTGRELTAPILDLCSLNWSSVDGVY